VGFKVLGLAETRLGLLWAMEFEIFRESHLVLLLLLLLCMAYCVVQIIVEPKSELRVLKERAINELETPPKEEQTLRLTSINLEEDSASDLIHNSQWYVPVPNQCHT
jgi:hypothetical protein